MSKLRDGGADEFSQIEHVAAAPLLDGVPSTELSVVLNGALRWNKAKNAA